MRLEFATATRILFGTGTIQNLPQVVREFGRRALFVTGRDTTRIEKLFPALESAGVTCSVFSGEREPTLDFVRAGARQARNCDVVTGFGGGSAIDAAKAIAALASNSGEPLDYLEVIGRGQKLERPPLPFIAVPTTAGTGAEVTRNAVLGSPQHHLKASLRSPLLLAKVALVDPELTLDVPPAITASTGLDTLTQLIEPYVSIRCNPLTDLFCVEGLKRAAESLPAVYRDGHNLAARESMSFASLLSGLSLANAGLGVVHGFAAPLGGMLHAPHGALCAAILPHGMEANIKALRARAPENKSLARYTDIARLLTSDPRAQAEDATKWVAALCHELGVRSLSAYGFNRQQIPETVAKASAASSMKANPLPLNSTELTAILEHAL